ncbi:MAG: Molybdopterin molybdenumtransferase [Firmicutes bacterium]|nr:Molybdopterin molybdenumtransferase [Bacillota bacterium]
MRQHFLESISLSEAERRIITEFGGVMREEVVPAQAALGRVTAQPVFAKMSSPHYASAAMDGIAVRAGDTKGARPGRPIRLLLGQGYVPVDTGDALPEGRDAVIMIEQVVLEGDEALIELAVPAWQHVRPVGEDIVATDLLLPRYHQVTAVDIGAMLAAGVLELSVLGKLHAVVIPTGDELIAPIYGATLRAGEIVEFNSSIIAATLKEWGVDCLVTAPVRDDRALLIEAIKRALCAGDLVLVIAGTSTGRGDHTADVVAELGELLFHGVAMRPGKPVLVGRIGDVPVFGLPGYPVSAALCLHMLVKPLVFARFRQPLPQEPTIGGVLSRRLVSGFGVEEFVRVQVGQVNERTIVTPLGRGAGAVTSLVKADGYVRVPHTTEGFAEGEEVAVKLWRPWTEIASRLVCSGSHDVILDVLADILKTKHNFSFASSHVGSLAGLMALSRNLCHCATTHLLDEETGVYNIPIIKRLMPDRDLLLVNVVKRWQGFMVRPGLAREITSWRDLGRCRFVNRQSGSGTRVLLDYHLQREGIDPSAIAGYEREETTHLAVACAVSAKEAEVGLGIKAAAGAFGLSFIPLCLENYDLLVPSALLKDERVVALLSVLGSRRFIEAMAQLGLEGYDTGTSGQVVWRSHA